MGLWPSFLNKKKTADEQPTGARRAINISNSGTWVSPDTSMQVAAFYRGVIFLSSQIAKLPWKHKNSERKIIKSKVSRLLDLAPNKEMSAFMYKMWIMQQTLIHGNSYSEIERDNLGNPIALWPLKSEDVCPVRDDKGSLFYRINSSSLSNPTGQQVFLRPEDVFHIRNFHTKDGIVGQGICSYGADVLGIALGSNQMAGSLFNNGGLPSGVVTVTGTLDDDAYDRLKKSWKEAYSGKNGGATAILEEGASYTPTSFSPTMLQFLESRQFSVTEIARYLGVPTSKLYDTTAATKDNSTHASLEVVTDTLDPWVINLAQEADIKLLNYRMRDEYTEIDLRRATRADIQTRAAYYKDMEQSAAMTANEIRAEEGYPNYDGGDTFYIASNNFTPVDRLNEIIDANIESKNNATKSANETAQQASQLAKTVKDFLNNK